jgi:hypothetical protein
VRWTGRDEEVSRTVEGVGREGTWKGEGEGIWGEKGLSVPKILERRLSLSLSGICCGIGSWHDGRGGAELVFWQEAAVDRGRRARLVDRLIVCVWEECAWYCGRSLMALCLCLEE